MEATAKNNVAVIRAHVSAGFGVCVVRRFRMRFSYHELVATTSWIRYTETATFPVCHRLFSAQAIEVDGDVDIFASGASQKILKALPPVITQDCAFAFSILLVSIVCPGVHNENSSAFRATVAENLMWPPAFKIAATPNTRTRHIWKFQGAIDPSTAG